MSYCASSLWWYFITIPKRVLVQRPVVQIWQLEIKVCLGLSRQYEHKLNWERYLFFVCVVHNWRKEISTSITKRKGFKLTKSFQYKGKEWFGSIFCHSVIISIFFLLDSTVILNVYMRMCIELRVYLLCGSLQQQYMCLIIVLICFHVFFLKQVSVFSHFI